jgi:hypothetical protein
MNKAILTLLAIGFMATACYASDGSVQNVNRGTGTYQVGSHKKVTQGNVFVGYDRPIPISASALREGSDFNKQIPPNPKPKWNGN